MKNQQATHDNNVSNLSSLANPVGNAPGNKYGLLSMIAMIIGIVVASGIFVKNTSIFADSQSTIIAICGWIIAGLIVLAMAVAFIEISSGTKNAGKTGTIANWAQLFIGKKTSLIIGIFFTILYFPIIICSLSFFAVSFIGQAFTFNNPTSPSVLNSYLFTTFLGIAVIFIILLVNTWWLKPGKIFQNFGTIIKFIPLFFLIFLAIVISIGWVTSSGDTNNIFNPGDPIANPGISNGLVGLLMILPAILFSFDGFLFADSLSTEAKKPKTYQTALIISILFVIAIYIFFSISVYYLADLSTGDVSLAGALTNVFPNQGWIIIVIYLLMSLSILTAVNGLTVVLFRNFSELSRSDLLPDPEGQFLRRNKAHIAPRSAIVMSFMLIITAIILRILDGVPLLFDSTAGDLSITDFSTSITALFAFVLYSVILIAGIFNRYSKKVSVDRQIGYIFASTIASIAMFFSAGFLFYILFIKPIIDANLTVDYWTQLAFTVLFFSLWILLFLFFSFKNKKITVDQANLKNRYKLFYDSMTVYSDRDFNAFFHNSNLTDQLSLFNRQSEQQSKVDDLRSSLTNSTKELNLKTLENSIYSEPTKQNHQLKLSNQDEKQLFTSLLNKNLPSHVNENSEEDFEDSGAVFNRLKSQLSSATMEMSVFNEKIVINKDGGQLNLTKTKESVDKLSDFRTHLAASTNNVTGQNESSYQTESLNHTIETTKTISLNDLKLNDAMKNHPFIKKASDNSTVEVTNTGVEYNKVVKLDQSQRISLKDLQQNPFSETMTKKNTNQVVDDEDLSQPIAPKPEPTTNPRPHKLDQTQHISIQDLKNGFDDFYHLHNQSSQKTPFKNEVEDEVVIVPATDLLNNRRASMIAKYSLMDVSEIKKELVKNNLFLEEQLPKNELVAFLSDFKILTVNDIKNRLQEKQIPYKNSGTKRELFFLLWQS